jgi:ABC-type Mn2+/Zn2+ transport system ATPase subunit
VPEPAPAAAAAPPAVGGGRSIAAEGLSVSFGHRPVLDRVSFTVPPGTSAAVIGPNGSGKTTLLNTIVGIVAPSAGSVSAGPVSGIAYVLQHRHTSSWLPLTAGEVLTMGRYAERGLLRRLRSRDRELIRRAADRMEVEGLLGRQFGELSGGQRQRVLLAQALVREPSVLLLDEPITGLDLASQQRILDLIDAEVAAGTTVLLTTHHLDEARHCDAVLLLAGRVVAFGPPDLVLQPTQLRSAFGDRMLGDHHGHDHGGDLLMIDDHGHGQEELGAGPAPR